MNRLILSIFLASGALAPLSVQAACGDAERATDVFRAYDGCDKIRAAKKANGALTELITAFAQTGYCQTVTDRTPVDAKWKEVCRDPASYVCTKSDGRLFDSQCRLVTNEQALAPLTPDFVDHKCAFESAREKLLKSHAKECKGAAGECAAQLKKKYAKEIQAIETKLAYTPARIARITRLFTLLKDRTIEKIEKSARIPAESKMILFAKVSQTELVLPPNDDEMPGCGHTTAIGPSTDIANFDGQVTACIGFMANLDRASDADILVSMGHEIAHSIDPCALETEFAKFAKPDAAPFPSETTYPDVVSCLRGGPKGAPCQKSNLHCNTEKGIADKCNEYSSGVEGDATAKAAGLKECQDYVKLTPSCPWGSNPKKSLADASSARVDPEPVSQIRESFSDFVGAEVAGTILEEQVRSGKLRGQDRLDALIGIAADFASLHGRCEDGNSNDVHQPGKLRINQNFFSSASFANAVCGKNPTPASLPGGPQKCSAF